MTGKKIAISVGPIPARLDSVKFITNRFKGGLAAETAMRLAGMGHELTVVAWSFTANMQLQDLESHPNVKEIVRVRDVFEYYDWFVAHAKDFDAFVMAAAVANLTPVKPYEGKFPSHNYQPGDEFDIRFTIAPRAIDAIKPLNPRACLIGYKLFDCDDEDELAGIAAHTLSDAKANIIFANTPRTAKSHKIAVLPDGTRLKCSFDEHVELIHRAVMQDYFRTDVTPLSDHEISDPRIREALAAVKAYETSFGHYGTVAVPVDGCPGMFATTSRGHKAGPVLVRSVDHGDNTVYASGKATLNAPALDAMLEGCGYKKIVIHRHFTDPKADKAIAVPALADWRMADPAAYIFPGTEQETEYVRACLETDAGGTGCMEPTVIEAGHGYLATRRIAPIDWDRYLDLYPEKYQKPQAEMLEICRRARENGQDVLEIGGNKRPMGNLSYDPYVAPDPDFARRVDWDEVKSGHFPVTVCFNAINYLSRAEITAIAANSDIFVANTFRFAPHEKIDADEYAVRVPYGSDGDVVLHGLRLADDSLMRHMFRTYDLLDYEAMGLKCLEYGTKSMLVFKGLYGGELALLMAQRHKAESAAAAGPDNKEGEA